MVVLGSGRNGLYACRGAGVVAAVKQETVETAILLAIGCLIVIAVAALVYVVLKVIT